MSEELEWELYDIFASGIFAFPIYEHNSARRIVRYLLMRGVPAEDVAAAIEDHAVDLRSWLERRPGHHMVGEWVMAWLNESRDQYKADRRDRRLVCRMRRNNCIVGNAYPAAFHDRAVAPPCGNFLEPFYGFPVRGRGDSAFDEISSTTASTTSSDSESDDEDNSSAVYRSRNASSPQRKLSRRSSSQGTYTASRYSQQLTPLTRQKHTLLMAGRSGGIAGSSSVSGQVVVERSDDYSCSSELTMAGAESKANCGSNSIVAMLRRTTGSEGDLRHAESGDGIVKRWLSVALHRISRSCPHLVRPTVCATPPRHIPETSDVEADDWRQSYGSRTVQMPAVTSSSASSSSRFRNIHPPLLDIVITSGSTEFPVPDSQQRTAAALSSTSLTTAAASASAGDRDSFPDPPDSGNVSDLQCNCSASVCCGGGVGYEHNCPSPIPSDPQQPPIAVAGHFAAAAAAASSSLQSLSNDGVADRQPVSMGAGTWCDCDRCLFALPQCIDHNGTAARWHHRTVGYASTSNLSTSSCCRHATIGGDREEVIDGRWPPSSQTTTIHDIFPVS